MQHAAEMHCSEVAACSARLEKLRPRMGAPSGHLAAAVAALHSRLTVIIQESFPENGGNPGLSYASVGSGGGDGDGRGG